MIRHIPLCLKIKQHFNITLNLELFGTRIFIARWNDPSINTNEHIKLNRLLRGIAPNSSHSSLYTTADSSPYNDHDGDDARSDYPWKKGIYDRSATSITSLTMLQDTYHQHHHYTTALIYTLFLYDLVSYVYIILNSTHPSCVCMCVLLVRATETGAPAGSRINIHTAELARPYIDQAIADSRSGIDTFAYRRKVHLFFFSWGAKNASRGCCAACSIFTPKGESLLLSYMLCVCVCIHIQYICTPKVFTRSLDAIRDCFVMIRRYRIFSQLFHIEFRAYYTQS